MNRVKRAVHAADALQQRHAWLAVPVAVWKKFGDDQAGNLAALIAYYSFVAIFPLLLVLVTVLDLVLKNDPGLQHRLLNSALSQYPVIGQQLGHIGRLHQSGLILVIGLGLVGTTVLVTLASGGADRVIPAFGGKVVALLVSLAANVGVFWLSFRLGTAKEIGWRQLRLGAVIAGVIWQILQYIGGYFVSHQLAHASPIYGTFAVVIGLLAWLYLEAELTLYAVQINVVIAFRLWPRSVAPPPYTEQDRQAFQLYAQTEERSKIEDIVVGDSDSEGNDDREKT
jgi:membrane protein